MALTRITKGVIKPNENYDTHNIVSTGIVTAVGLDINGNADVSGNFSVGGVLTYEDVTSIDSVGIITAQKGIHVGAGLSVVGVTTMSGALNANGNIVITSATPYITFDDTNNRNWQLNADGGNFVIKDTTDSVNRLVINSSGNVSVSNDLDVDGHTNLDNVSIAGVTTFASGNVQLASDSQRLQLGSGQDLWMYHTGTSGGGHALIQNDYGTMYMLSDNFTFRDKSTNHDVFRISRNNSVSLFYQNDAKLSTNAIGVTIDNVLYISGPAGNPGRLRFQEGGALSEIRGVRNTDSNSLLYFDTEISGTTATRMMINGSGHLRAATDSTYDLGTSAVRWRNIYADTYYGDGSNLTGVSGVTINNNADNRVITGSGTANTLNGESKVNIDSSGRLIIGTNIQAGSNDHYDDITIDNSNSTGNAGSAGITLVSNNGQYGGLIFEDPDVDQAGYIKYYHNSNLDQLVFGVNNGARWEMISAGHWVPHSDSSYDVGTNTKRVRNVYTDSFYATSLSYNGNQLKLGDGNGPTSSAGYYDDIKIDNSDNSSGEAGGTGIELISGNQTWAGIIFSDSDAAQRGYVKYSHIDDYTTIASGGSERMRFLSTGGGIIQARNCTGALTLPLGTTAQRPTAATGMIRYNSTETELEMYNGTEWLAIKTVPNTINLYYLVIGGGGAGGGSYRAGGGGAGAYRTNWNNEAQGGGQSVGSAFAVDVASTPTYSVIIGSGGSPSNGSNGGAGGTTTFATIVANGGTGGARYEQPAPSNSGTGSGGGGGGHSGTLRAGASGGTYGYAGGAGSDSSSYQCGGGGGGAAGAGIQGNYSTSRSNAGDGGSALASTITGSSILRAGGGGAGAYGGGNSTGGGINGGPAGGGGGAGRGAYGYRTGESATANTGSGGGGSPGSQNEIGGSGGSGLIILRYSNAATATYTSGVTYTRSTIGSDVVDTITLTSNSSQSVTFS